jgi:hypothetical protein
LGVETDHDRAFSGDPAPGPVEGLLKERS